MTYTRRWPAERRLYEMGRRDLMRFAQKDGSTYDTWRQSVRFTNAEIVAAFERLEAAVVGDGSVAENWRQRYRFHADRLRVDGARLSMAEFRMALAELVQVCAAETPDGPCGRPAHYRMGQEGRCRQHRDVVSDGVAASRRNRELRRAVVEREIDAVGQLKANREKFHKAMQQRRRS